VLSLVLSFHTGVWDRNPRRGFYLFVYNGVKVRGSTSGSILLELRLMISRDK